MALCHNCDESRIEYIANGTQNSFEFQFEYYKRVDVAVAFWDEDANAWERQENSIWSFVNDTNIQFDEVLPADQKFIIYRCTDVTELAEFYPGAAIKAADLNDNFFILSAAIEEARCEIESSFDQSISGGDLITEEQQTTDGGEGKIDDEHVFSAAASKARHDSYIQPSTPPTVVYQKPGKLWQNTDKAWTSYWQESPGEDGGESKTWVAYVNTGPRGPKGDPGLNGIPDVPVDGIVYGRQDENWVAISFNEGTLTGVAGEAPIVINNTTPAVPKVTLDLSVLTDI